MTERPKKRIGEILIENGSLTPELLEEALNHQKKEGGLIGQILIRLGYISEETLIASIGKQLHIPYLPLSNYAINMEAAQQMASEFCKRHLMIIFDADERNIFLAMSDPLDDSAAVEIEKKFQKHPQIFVSTPTEILNMIDIVFHSNSANKDLKKAG